MAMISPKRPMALPKISMIKILTKSELLAASARAAPEPTIPTQTPHAKLLIPTVSPAPNILKPAATKTLFCSAKGSVTQLQNPPKEADKFSNKGHHKQKHHRSYRQEWNIKKTDLPPVPAALYSVYGILVCCSLPKIAI